MAPVEESETPAEMWNCPACTLQNEPDATKCAVCEEPKPTLIGTSHGKGKGRVLRPRVASSTASASKRNVVKSRRGEDSSGSDGDNDDDDDDGEEDFVISLSNRASSTRRGRGRSGERTGRGGRGSSGASSASGNRIDSVLAIVDGCDATCATSKVTDKKMQHPPSKTESTTSHSQGTGAPQRPLELDADGSDRETEEESLSVAEDSAGGTPALFGRGWGDKGHPVFDAAANETTKPKNSGTAGGSSSTRRQGLKRQRPLPPAPPLVSDNVFRTGIHAHGGNSGSDGEGRPLVPPPRRARVPTTPGGGLPWRWPSPPAGLAVLRAEAPQPPPPLPAAVRGVEGGSSDDENVRDRTSGHQSDSSSDILEQKTRSAISEVTIDKDVGNMGCSDGEVSAGGTTKVGAKETGLPGGPRGDCYGLRFPPQPQERKPPRKRSRLSQPRRRSDELLAKVVKSEEAPSPKQGPAEGGTVHLATDGSGAAGVARSRQGIRGPNTLAGATASPRLMAQIDRGLPSEERGEETEECEIYGCSGGRYRNHEEAPDPNDTEIEPLNGLTPNRFPTTEKGTTDNQQESAASMRVGDRRDVTNNVAAGAAAARRPGAARAATTAVRLPAKAAMSIDMDDDSDSSDDSETQGSSNDGAAEHVGRAMDGIYASSAGISIQPAATAGAAVVSTSSASPPTRQEIPPDTAVGTDVDCLGTVDEPTQPPAPRTPSRQKHEAGDEAGETAGASPEDSSDPSATGLVDTPPSQTRSASARKLGSGKKTTRKATQPSKASDVLTASGRRRPSHTMSPISLVTRERTGKWACGACTLENRARAKSCQACYAIKPAPPASTVGGTGDLAEPDVDAAARIPRIHGASPDERDGEHGSMENGRVESLEGKGTEGTVEGGTDSPGRGASTRAVEESASCRALGNGDEGDGGLEKRTAASLKRNHVVLDRTAGFVGDVGAILSEEGERRSEYDDYDAARFDGDDDDDEDYIEGGDETEQEDDDEAEDPEMIGSQIEARWSKVVERGTHEDSPPPRLPCRKRRRENSPHGEVLDLTEAVGDAPEKGTGLVYDVADVDRKTEHDLPADAHYVVEDISDDDFTRGCSNGSGADWDAAAGGSGTAEGLDSVHALEKFKRKYRFFATVEEHRLNGSSCVNFEALLPESGASRTKSYEVRRRARDAKQNKRKRGTKANRGRAASKRGKGKARGGAASASTSGGTRGRSGGGQASFGGPGGLPSAAWIPAGVRNAAGSSGAGQRRGRGAAATSGGVAEPRQPFNHYQRSDDVVDDTAGAGGGLHWEHAGRSTFGD